MRDRSSHKFLISRYELTVDLAHVSARLESSQMARRRNIDDIYGRVFSLKKYAILRSWQPLQGGLLSQWVKVSQFDNLLKV